MKHVKTIQALQAAELVDAVSEFFKSERVHTWTGDVEPCEVLSSVVLCSVRARLTPSPDRLASFSASID
jgi:hypothetical protein